jgi:hypothetical protein
VIGIAWDGWQVQRECVRLLVARSRYRLQRTIMRMASPRRIVATLLTVIFACVYLINGIFILATRQPADPETLRLWLSGGMVLYAIYHAVRCAWSTQTSDLELQAAESLWLGGAPIHRSTLAIYQVAGLVMATAAKTVLLATVLFVDAKRIELLCVGVFASLLLLEVVRLILARWASALDERSRIGFRIATTTIAIAVVLQIIARIFANVPTGSGTATYIVASFASLGQTAASDIVGYLAMPWSPAANVAVSDGYGLVVAGQLVMALASLPIAIVGLVCVDARSERIAYDREVQRLATGDLRTRSCGTDKASALSIRWAMDRRTFLATDLAAMLARQWITIKRYAVTIAISFLIPTLLCLSPLVTGKITDQWFFVVGGIAMCTMLLAPPALRIDFRRDLKRMLLLRSLPVRPVWMVMGQIGLPVAITCGFQWVTLAVAALVTTPGWSMFLLWAGVLPALSLFTFAIENAIFLAFPHHEKTQGIMMMVRAKLTFLGKIAVLVAALAGLALWVTWCRNLLPETAELFAVVIGAVTFAWAIALASVAVTTWCWSRFDLAFDVPPE